MSGTEPRRWEESQASMRSGYASRSVSAARDGEGMEFDVAIQKRRSPLSASARFAYVCAGLFLNVMSAFVVWFDSRDRVDAYAREALKMSFIGACANTVIMVAVGIWMYMGGMFA